MDILERLTELRDLMKQDLDKAVLQDAINEIEYSRFKIESWENFHKLMESNWAKEKKKLQEALRKIENYAYHLHVASNKKEYVIIQEMVVSALKETE